MSKSGKIENKYKYHVMMMKNAGIKYKGDFLDDLVAAKNHYSCSCGKRF